MMEDATLASTVQIDYILGQADTHSDNIHELPLSSKWHSHLENQESEA